MKVDFFLPGYYFWIREKIGCFSLKVQWTKIELSRDCFVYNSFVKQEYIPVGCLPSAAVAVCRVGCLPEGGSVCPRGVCLVWPGGVCLVCPGGCLPGGVYLVFLGGVCPGGCQPGLSSGVPGRHPPDRILDTRLWKHYLPQLRLRKVINFCVIY